MSTDAVAQDQLRAIVERIERVDEEIRAMNDDKKEIYSEAKGDGFDVAAIKHVVKLRRMDHDERMHREAIIELYLSALGMAVAPTEEEQEAAVSRARAPAPARTREIIEEIPADEVVLTDHVDSDGNRLTVVVDSRIAAILNGQSDPPHDPETGEIIERAPGQDTLVAHGQNTEPATQAADQGEASAVHASPETFAEPSASTAEQGTEGAHNPTSVPTDSQAKASTGNAATAKVRAREDGTGRSGEASRPSVGGGTDAPIHENASGSEALSTDGGPAEGSASIPGQAGQESTAARMDVRDNSTEANGSGPILDPAAAITPQAGTQAPPVDTRTAIEKTMADIKAKRAGTMPRRPGETWEESCPPVPVTRPDFAREFPERLGMSFADLKEDIKANGVQRPIVKMGNAILDGWARYNAARELIGQGLLSTYPVKEYDGSDPLADLIRWQCESRPNLPRQSIASRLIKLVPDRAADIAELFGVVLEQAERTKRVA